VCSSDLGRGSWGAAALNVNGAPLALLRAALVGRAPSAASEALALRQRGERVPESLVSVLTSSSDETSLKRVPLRATSSAFGFLVTVTRGGFESRCWLVIEEILAGANPASASGSSGGWGVVERRRAAR